MRSRAAAAAGLFLLACAELSATPRAVNVEVRVEAVVDGWDQAYLSAELVRLLGIALESDFGGRLAVAPASDAAARLDVWVRGAPGALTARSVLSLPGKPSRSATSRLPDVALLVPVVAGELVSLWAGERPQEVFPPAGLRPLWVGSIHVASVAEVIGLPAGSRATDIAFGPEGLLIAFAGGPVCLDPLLRVTAATARDLDLLLRAPTSAPVARIGASLTGMLPVLLADSGTLLLRDSATGKAERALAPGGPFAGLAAMPWGGFALWRQASPEGGAELLVGRRKGASTATASYRIAPAFVTAVAADYDGNLWLYDAVERRIRIFDGAGHEVHSVKPLLDRSAVGVPLGLELYPDGSLLVSGEGEVWKLDASGMPIWRLDGIDAGGGARELPRSFRFALQGSRGSFAILDPEAQEIHLFSERAAAAMADETGRDELGDLEVELAGRLRSDGSAAEAKASWCLERGLLAFARELLGRRRDNESRSVLLVRRSLDRAVEESLARAAADRAQELAAALDFAGSEPFFAAAAERYRALRASFPAEAGYAETAEALARRRLEVRETVSATFEADVRIRAPTLHGMLSGGAVGSEGALSISVARPGGASGVSGLLAEVAASRAARGGVTALGDVAAPLDALLALRVGAEAGFAEEDLPVTIRVRLSGTVAGEPQASLHEVVSTLRRRTSFDASWFAGLSRPDFLAWLAGPADPSLGRLRRTVAGPSATPLDEAALVLGLLADVFRVGPPAPDGEATAPRRAAAARAGSSEDWLLLAAALMSGVDRAFLEAGGAAWLVVDTGLPLDGSLSANPSFAALSALGGRGTLLLALSAPAGAAAPGLPLADSARRAASELTEASIARGRLAWIGPTGAPVRSAFLPVWAVPGPGLAERAARDAAETRELLGLRGR